MDWTQRDEWVRRMLSACRERQRCHRQTVQAEAELRTARKAERRASEVVERLLTELTSRQGYLPFDSGPGGHSADQAAAQLGGRA